MAINFFKKGGDEAPGGAVNTDSGPNPEKARKFFEHARTVQETGNYEYAMQLWLRGMRFDPNSNDGLEAYFNCAANYLNDASSKKGPGKELVKSVQGSSEIEKYLRALLEWSLKPKDATLAVRALELAAKNKLTEPGTWIGRIAFARSNAEANPRRAKDLLIKVSEYLGTLGQYELSVQAAEAALKHDPTDGELAAHIRSLAATATMNKGGYDKAGQEGGFRANIRDAQKQRELDESERIVKTEDTVDRLISTAEAELIKRPNDLPTIEALAKRLLERGKPADEERAHQLYMSAHAMSKQYRYKMLAGDIRIRQTRRKVNELETMLQSAPGNEMVQRMLATQHEELLKLELDEYKQRVEAYPTDVGMKFELGKRYFLLGNNDEAIPLFQEAQIDAKIRPNVLNYLGQAFHRIHYHDEAVQTFRGALELHGMSPELHREIRYNLLCAMLEQARAHGDIASAREADKIASSIATEQFNYRDIRAKRDEIKKLIASLTS